MTSPSERSREVEATDREAAAVVFDRLARKSGHPEVATLNRHYAKVIRAGEGDDYDAVQAAAESRHRLASTRPHAVTVERQELTPAQLDATIDALNFCLADDWDESSHGHSPAVYERALGKLMALQGRVVRALAKADAILSASEEALPQAPFGYWVEQRYADPVILRAPAYIPEPSKNCKVTPLYTRPIIADDPKTEIGEVENKRRLALEGAVSLEKIADEADDNGWQEWAATMRQTATYFRAALSAADTRKHEAGEDYLDDVFTSLIPPGNVWAGNEPQWQVEAYRLLLPYWEAETDALYAAGGDEPRSIQHPPYDHPGDAA